LSAFALGFRTATRGADRRAAILLLVACAVVLALVGPRHGAAPGPAPSFLRHAIGKPARQRAPLPSTSFAKMRSSVTRGGVRVAAPWAKLSLFSRDAGSAPWRRYSAGAARTTAFGSETITLSGISAEEYLTVDRHLGLHTWRWSIDSTLDPYLKVDGTVGFADPRGKPVLLTIARPAILDAKGRAVAVAGLRWGLEHARGHALLTLRLDDTALPAPYTIDPAISLSASAFTTVKGSGQNGNFTLTIPAGAASGDLLVVQLVQRSTTAPTAPVAAPAWTLFSSQTDATNGLAQYIYTRVMSATDVAGTTAYTWTVPTGVDAAGGLVALRNVDGAPTNPSQQSAAATGTTSPATATVTTDSIIGSNNDYVIAFYGGKGNFTFSETNASLTGLWSTATNQIPNGSGQLTGNNVGSGSSGASRANSLVSAGQFAASTAVTPNATLSAANAWMLNVLAFRVAVPYNQALPTTSGTVAVGQTLTAAVGTWSNSPTGYTYQWLRCDSSGANCSSIAGATASTYALTSADSGSTIRVQVTATNALGTGQTVQSAQTALVPSPDGSGTLTTVTSSVTAGSIGNTIVFTYTAAAGGMTAGKVQLTVPAGWSAPSTTGAAAGYTTASTGTVGVAGQVITISNVTLAANAVLTITYGSKASGGAGATAATAAGAQTWSAAEASTSGGTITGLASSPSITVNPAAANKVAWSQQPSNTGGGSTISPSPTVSVQDQYGNTITSSSASITVAIGTNPSGGTLSGTTTVSAVNGVATFSGLSINKSGTGYTLAASSTGLTGATSSTFNVTVGAASKLSFTQQPTTATAGSSISPAVSVTVQDAGGNTVTTSSASITIAIGTNAGGGTLSGTATANASSGVATFSGLSIDKSGTGYTLTAASTGLTGATSSSFNINAGAANKLAFTQQPTSATAGSSISPAITVTVQDSLGNTVTSSSASVTAAIGTNPGGGTLSGTATTNASSGVATFSNLSINKAGTGYTLTAASAGLTGATSSSFNINVAAVDATQSTVSASPSSVTADGSTTSTITVTAKDAFGNAVSGQSVSFSQGAGSSTITTVSGTTNASGQATFTVKDTVAQSVTYTATIGATTVLQTASVTFTPGAATHLTVGAPASSTAGSAFSVTVTAYDANNNVATGYSGIVHFTSTDAQAVLPSNYTFVPGTDAGAHTFTNAVTLKTAGSKSVTATDTVTGTITGSATVTVSAAGASAAASTVSASPSSILADNSTTSTVTATLTDAYGNAISGKTMTLTAGSGASAITTVSGTTNGSGQASWTVKDASVENVTYTAKDTTDNVTITQTAAVSFTTGPVTAAQSTVSASPASVTADGATTSTVTVTLKDAQSHPVSGKTVTLAKSGGSSTVTTVSGTTNASGQATFTVKDTVAETTTYTATDSTDSVTVTQTASVTFTPGAVSASQSTVSASPTSITADGSTTSTVTVTLEDANGNAVPGKTVSLAKSGGSSTITTVSGTTDASGHATFTVKDSVAESTTYTATDGSDAVTVTQTASVTFTAGAVSTVQSTITSAPGSVTADGSATSTITVTAKDAFGNAVAAQSVSLSQGAGSSTITTVSGTTNGAGQATFTVTDTTAETVTYAATIGASTILATASVAFTPGAATHLGVTPPASATAGSAFSVTVTALDAHGNTATAYAGTVHFTSSDGQAVLPANYTFVPGTDAGTHTFSSAVTLKTAGSKSVTATDAVTGTINGSASVTVSTAAASAAASTVGASPASVVADGATASTVTATITDAYGNPIAGKTVTLAKSGGSSTITTVSGTTNASGQATFTVKDAVAETTTYTATDATDAVAVTQTASVTFLPGTPTAGASTVSASPASVLADGTTTSTVTVTLKDANANAVPGKTVTLAAGSGSSTIVTVTGVTDASGQATFTVKDAAVEAVTYTATDTTDAVTVAQTATVTFTLGAVSASTSTVAASPASVTADGSAASTVTVTLKDAQSHPVPGKTVSLAAGSGSSTTTTVSGTTNASGQATFTVNDAVAEAVTYTATDTTDTTTVSQTATVTFTPGPVSASQSTVSASPTSIVSDGSTTSTLTVTLKDANGNAVPGKTVTLAKSGGSSTIATVSGTTNAAGHATFTVKDTVAEPATYTATDTTDSLTVTQTASVTFTSGAVSASQSTVSASPASVTADGSTTSTIAVTLVDESSNPIAGKSVTLAKSGGSSTISTVSGTTDASGRATFAVTDTAVESTTYTATDSTDSVTVTQPATVSFTAGAVDATASTVAASAGSVTADGSTTSTVTVTANDAFAHPLAGQTVSLSQGAGSSTITTVSGTTNASGRATFSVEDTTAEAVTYTATVGATTVLQTASVTFTPGAADGGRTTMTAAPATLTAGGSTTITVHAKDALGNPLTAGGAAVVLSTDHGTLSSVADNGDGTYTATLGWTGTGTAHVTGTIGGAAIGNPTSATFGPGAADASQSAISAAPGSITADGASTTTLTVHAKDAYGNALASGGATVALTTDDGTLSSVTDHGDGTYSATLTAPTASGTAHVTGTLGGGAIGSPATVAFVPGAADPGHTTIAAAPGTLTADGSSTSTITVHVADAFGNALVAGGDTVALSTDLGALSSVTDNGNGTYTATLTATAVVGTAHVGGTVNGGAIGSPTTVTLVAGAADAAHSTLAAAPGSLVADGSASATVTVRAKDAHGNALTTGGATVVLSTDRGTLSPVADHADGTYTATITSTSAGAAHLSGTLNGSALGTTATVTFTPGPVDATHSTIAAAPASLVADGSATSTITVQAKDANGNLLASGGAFVVLSADAGSLSLVTDHGDGTYTATLTAPTATGTAHVTGTIDGAAIGNPASVALVPGPANAAHTVIFASPSSIGADGATTSTITVRAEDAHGNDVTTGGATVVLATDRGTIGSVADNGDGTYTATLTSSTTTGTAHVTGTLNRTAIGNPATVQFVPSAGNPTHSVISATPASIVADGSSTSTITVQAKDLNDNDLGSGGATIVLATDRGTLSSVGDNGDGTYTATLTSSTTAGTAHVTGTLDGGTIGHPTTVSFVPGAASAAHSVVSAAPGSITADGSSTATVTVRARDVNDNDLTSGGAAVVLSTDKGALSSVTDHGDGTYTATLTSSTATGTAHLGGTLGGAPIGTSAAVAFVAGAASGSHSSVSASPTTLTADGTGTSAITVRLADANGNDLGSGGAAVTLATDKGTLSSVTDNGDGTYSATLTAPTTAGVAHVTGTVNGQALATTASVALVPGAVSASHSTVVAASATASTDTGNTVAVTVTVTDAHANPIQGAHVVLTQGATSASISPNPVAGADTDSSGKAVFTVSDALAEPVVFSATASGTLVDQTAAVQFEAGAAAQLVYGRQPGGTTAGATIAPSVVLRVLDAHGNLTASGTGVTVGIKSGTGATGATLAGTATRSAVNGVATFDDLAIAKAGTGYVLTAGASGVTAADSTSFDVATGAASAAHTTIAASPTSINADGTSGTSTVTVQARDAFDNAVASGGATVALATSRGSLSGVTDNGDGTYTATLTATGQSGTATVTGTLNGSAIGHPAAVMLVPPVPVAAIDGGVASSPTSATTATFTFHSPNDDGNTTFECSLDGAAFSACTSPATVTGLADGGHTFRVHGVNANGPGSNVSQSWTVDTTGPTTTLTTAPGAYSNHATEPLAATATDATTSVAAVDFRYATSAATCPSGTLVSTDTTPPYTASWTLPADGSYVICAVATDAVGNTGTAATSSVVVDQTKPVVSLAAFGTVVGATTYVHGTPTLHANATDTTAGVASVDFSFAGTTSGSIAHVTAFPYDAAWDTAAVADGAYTVTAAAADRAGNADTSSRTVTVDNAPPAASLDDPGAYGHGTIPLSVTATDAGSGVDASATVVQSSPHGTGTWTTIAAPGSWTPADGTYDLRAIVKDNVGNQTVTATRTILVDNTAPAISADSDSAWHNSDVTVTLTASDGESGVASVEYKVDGAGSWTSGTSVAVPTSLGDGAHTVTYRATNRAGVTSAQQTATVKLDATPPTVSDPSVIPASTFVRGAVDLGSTVSDGTGSGIASTTYRLAAAGTPETTPASACATWGSAVASHFDTTAVADGTYALRTVAIDNALNGRCSNVATATTVKVDNTAPTTSDDAPFGAQNADVTVHLTASDNFSGVATTEYSVDGGAWTSGSSVTVAAPADHSDDGVHTISYRSTDAAGNTESTKTTQVAIDTTAPSGSGVDPAGLLSGTVQLDASPSETDIAAVEWRYRPAGSSGAWTSIGTDHAAPWQMPWMTTAVADGAYDLEAVFTDTSGNSTTQAFSTKTVDNTAPDGASVTAPSPGTDLSGTIALAATAHDATAGIDNSKTTFQIQATGDSGWSDVGGNHFDTTTKPDGPARVRVAVWDLAGNGPLYSAPIAFTIDNTAPTVALSAPADAAGIVSLTATGSADVATVAFAVSPHGAGTWTPVATASSSPFTVSWSTGSLADGLYDVRATATDLGSNSGTDVKTVRVDNTAPTATLTQPTAGATVGGAHVALAAAASDAGAGVASVTFQYRPHGSAGAYGDLSTTSSPPYTGTWDVTGLASGEYEVRVLVTDAAGNAATSATSVVTVDATPPSLTGFAVPGLISGGASLHVTTSADTASVVYGVSPSGGGGWTAVGSSSTLPSFAAAFDTTAVADGTYDVRATAVDRFGNAATLTVPNVRIDNTSPTIVSSTPADGAVVASVSSIDATASEDLSAVTSLELDGSPATFGATISGANVSFPTAALADGNHALTGELVDLAGNRWPFRINLTVAGGSSTAVAATSKNVSNVVTTTLGTVDSTATVTVPPNVWQQPLPSSDDWLVLQVEPMAGTPVTTSSLQAPASVVDVHMFWNLAGTEEHHFDAPIQVDLTDPTGGFGVAATLESGSWRRIPALDAAGSLPAGQQDGYWRSGGLVHILTRHLSVFGVLNGLADLQLAPPDGFSGVVAADGLTLRWSPGIPREQLQSFTLYSDGSGVRLPSTQFEAKLGAITSADSRRFTITETNVAAAESAPSFGLRVVPPVAGLAVADATDALAARTFTVGKTIPTYAPGVPAGTVVGPTDVQVLAEGSSVDLQVASSSVVRSPFSFVAATAPRVHATRHALSGRVVVTSRARIDVTLDAYPWLRLQRWHFRHVVPGSTVLRMTLRHPLKPGTYRLFWKATSAVDHSVARRVTWLTIVAPHRRVHLARLPEVVVVGATRTTQSVDADGRVRVTNASAEQAYLYGTYHDVAVIVVDVDVHGVALVRDLHGVFPETAIVAVSRQPARRAAEARAGAVAVPASTPPVTLAKLLLALAAG
jgi:adhesin/invasin